MSKSFDQLGNMPGTYTICIDPSIPSVQHARQIEYKEQIEKALQHMEDLQIITPVYQHLQNGFHQLYIHVNQMAHYVYVWIPKT